MNLERLVMAARAIRDLRDKQRDRTARWQKLAAAAKRGEDVQQRKRELERDVSVVDYSTAIDELCAALGEVPPGLSRRDERWRHAGR